MLCRRTTLRPGRRPRDWAANVRFYVSLDQDVQSGLNSAARQFPDDPSAIGRSIGDRGGRWCGGGGAHHSGHPGNSADAHDIAVIQLPAQQVAARWSFTPATLPTAGQLDHPRGLNSTGFVVAGYGTQEAHNGPGGQTHPGVVCGIKAPLTFDALNPTWVRLAMTAPQGNGGACYGDSGGPNLAIVGRKLVLAATTITGDTPCYATNVAYRMDTSTARSFLAPYVTCPELGRRERPLSTVAPQSTVYRRTAWHWPVGGLFP
jgi:hypothetical protein